MGKMILYDWCFFSFVLFQFCRRKINKGDINSSQNLASFSRQLLQITDVGKCN